MDLIRIRRTNCGLTREKRKLSTSRYARRHMRVEPLEDRRVLAVVSSLADSGPDTLRAALAGPDATITFSVSGTINLTSGALAVNRAVVIDGTGQSVTVNNTSAATRVFNVDDTTAANVAVTIQNLTITGGNTAPQAAQVGGGIRNTEALTLSNVTLSGNTAGSGGGIGLTGTGSLSGTNLTITNNQARYNGGGLSVSAAAATANVTNSTITGNTVGSANASSIDAFGGGVFTSGQLTLGNSTISSNTATHANESRLGRGGGAAANLQSGVLVLNNSTVSMNQALGGGVGGGITAEGRSRVTLSNSTVSQSFSDFGGGGISVNTQAFLTMIDSTVSGNTSRYNGGGIVSYGTSTITRSQILNNLVGEGTTGTYLSVGGGIDAAGTVTLTESVVAGNTADVPDDLGFGGGIGILGGTNCTVVDSEIRDNVAGRGGGVSLRDGQITIRGSVVSGNSSAVNGGGLRMMRTQNVAATVVIEDSTFANNTGDGGAGVGGSDYADGATGTSTLTLLRSTFSGNSSSYDGGALEVVGMDTTIENSTIYGNTSYNDGGGVWSSSDATYVGSTTVNFSTITGNLGFNAGGLDSAAGPTTIRNSIVGGNTANTGVGPDVRDTPLAAVIEFSLVQDVNGNNATAGTGNITGMSPDLGMLADNGGPTRTRLPNASSPVLGAADAAATLMEDQRGFTRPGSNSSRDMGSVERDGASPTLNLDFNNDGQYNCSDMDLLEAAIDAGMPVATFDVNQDGMLTSADVNAWLVDAGAIRFGAGRRFLPGDANLSGGVDGSDFGIWNANKFTAANRWCLGDFTQTGGVDGSDFGVWNANKFTSSDAGRASSGGPAAAAIPRSGTGRQLGGKGLELARAGRRLDASLTATDTVGTAVAVGQAADAAISVRSAAVVSLPVQEAGLQRPETLLGIRKISFGTERLSASKVTRAAAIDQWFSDLGSVS